MKKYIVVQGTTGGYAIYVDPGNTDGILLPYGMNIESKSVARETAVMLNQDEKKWVDSQS